MAPTPEERAFALYLAGRTQADIAEATSLDADAVRSVTQDRVAGRDLELARLDTLWAQHYRQAMTGDVESTAVCMSITRARLQIQRDWRRPPSSAGTADAQVVKVGGPEDIQQGWRILAGGAPAVAQALVDIAQHGRSEMARVAAATAVLDRIGLNPRQDITVRAVPPEFDLAAVPDDAATPSEIVWRRLNAIRNRHVAEGGDVVDAEIVPD